MPTAYLSCTYCALQALFIYYYLLLVIYVLYMQSVIWNKLKPLHIMQVWLYFKL